MTAVRKTESAALLAWAALPADDWQPEHWDTQEAARAACADLFRRLAAEANAADKRREASGKAPARRKQTKADPPELRDAKKAVRARSGGYCEARIEGVCEIQATNVHHIAGRGFDGCHDPALLLHVCGQGNATGCHGYIETHGGFDGFAQRHGHALPWGRPRTEPIAPVAGCRPDCEIDHRDGLG